MRWVVLVLLLFSCAKPVTHPIIIKVPAFEIWVCDMSKMEKPGYWWEGSKLLVIDGKEAFGKVYVDDSILVHEIRHMLNHLDSRFINPHKRR